MTTLTDDRKQHAAQHLDSAERHLSELRALIGSGEPTLGDHADRDHESVAVEAFGHWVLDLLDLGERAPSEAVPAARTQLVAALSKHADKDSIAEQPIDDYDPHFVDVFAGDDLVDAPDEELGVKPISYES